MEIDFSKNPSFQVTDEGLKLLKQTSMINPKLIETIVGKAVYEVPTYFVDDSGLQDGGKVKIEFCKGNKEDPNALRQEGFFTETLVAVCKNT